LKKWRTPINAKWTAASCARPFGVVLGIVTGNVWLGVGSVLSGVNGPKVRRLPKVWSGGKQGLVGHDWSPIAMDTSCELDKNL
jgi:hypothetical protein